jgi:leucyl-tRNA synthetase
LRITAYADELLDTLDDLDWPEVSKRLQRHWIGRSTGVEVQFPLATRPERVLSAFTTRIDTLFGVTFLAVAPGHPLLDELLTVCPNAAAVIGVQEALKQRAATAGRFSENRGLSSQGVDTGLWALHPITKRRLPIYVVSYVLAEHGTGVVMGVPAYDHRAVFVPDGVLKSFLSSRRVNSRGVVTSAAVVVAESQRSSARRSWTALSYAALHQ